MKTLTHKINSAWTAIYPANNRTYTRKEVLALPSRRPDGQSSLVLMHGILCACNNGKFYRAGV